MRRPSASLADGNRHAAGAKVIAALNEPGDLAVTEQPLNLPLLGGVALLDLGSHGGQGFQVVALGGAGGAADAVPAGAAAQQNHHVTGGGAFPADIFRRGGSNHRTALHALGDVALMVQFRHMTGSQTNLVAIGGVACRRGLAELSLGELAGEGIL